MPHRTRDHIDDEVYEELATLDRMDEGDVIGLALDAMRTSLESEIDELEKIRDRVVYYGETFSSEDLLEAIGRLKKILRDYT